MIHNNLLIIARKKHAVVLLKMCVPVNEKHYSAASTGFFPLVKVFFLKEETDPTLP